MTRISMLALKACMKLKGVATKPLPIPHEKAFRGVPERFRELVPTVTHRRKVQVERLNLGTCWKGWAKPD